MTKKELAKTLTNSESQTADFNLKATEIDMTESEIIHNSNLQNDMTRSEIIEILTNKMPDLRIGLNAMNSLWNGNWTNEQRLEMIQECYDIMLDKALDDKNVDDYEELSINLVVANDYRKYLRGFIELESQQLDKFLNSIDESEISKC